MKISKILKNSGMESFCRRHDFEGWEALTESITTLSSHDNKLKSKTRRPKVKESSEGFHSSRCSHSYIVQLYNTTKRHPRA